MVTTAAITVTIYPNNNGSITVAEGSNVILSCEAIGDDGRLNYQWMRVPESLPNESNGQNLTIHNIKVSDSGQYYCKVTHKTNSSINVSSTKVQVTARSK